MINMPLRNDNVKVTAFFTTIRCNNITVINKWWEQGLNLRLFYELSLPLDELIKVQESNLYLLYELSLPLDDPTSL